MALVIVSGLPSSGRSTRCKEIISDWQRRLDEAPSSSTRPPFSRIVHLEDSTAHLARSVYSSQHTEKPARASYLSLVSRSLVKDAIVVADGGAGLNIKGFRYQLWCAAREVGMACISVFVTASGEQCVRWNEKRRRIGSDCYDAATLAEMLQRFEEPNAMTRWDSPLFIIPSEPRASSSSDEASLDEWEDPPYDALWEALASKKSFSKAPPVVTHNRATSTNYLSVLESSSQALVAAMQQGLQHGVMGDSLPLAITLPNGASSGGSSLSITLALPASRRPPTPAHLQRLRRQFVKMHSTGFASGNVLGKVATDESRLKEGQTRSTRGKTEGQQQQQAAAPSANMSLEETIVRRFASWLEEILPTL